MKCCSGVDGALVGGLAFGDLRQARVVFVAVIVAAFVIDLEEAVEEDDLTGGAQNDLTIRAADIDGGAFHPGGGHLAGDGALPDQVVQLLLVGLGRFQLVGRHAHVGRADAFMRFLRVLGLVLVHPRGLSGTYSAPKRRLISSRAAITASGAMSMPSVRM